MKTTTQVITSEGNSLRLEFLSDNSVQKNGFAAIFFTDKVIFTEIMRSATLSKSSHYNNYHEIRTSARQTMEDVNMSVGTQLVLITAHVTRCQTQDI